MPTAVETQDYKGHQIKAGIVSGVARANVLRRNKLVDSVEAGSVAAAITAARDAIDRLEAIKLSNREADGMPSAQAYCEAFELLEPTFNEGYRAMLRAHLAAPDHMITATELADAAGYQSYSGANLHYGYLARCVAEELGINPPKRADGSTMWTTAIAYPRGEGGDNLEGEQLHDMWERRADDGHFEWMMRPQVVEALRKLGY